MTRLGNAARTRWARWGILGLMCLTGCGGTGRRITFDPRGRIDAAGSQPLVGGAREPSTGNGSRAATSPKPGDTVTASDRHRTHEVARVALEEDGEPGAPVVAMAEWLAEGGEKAPVAAGGPAPLSLEDLRQIAVSRNPTLEQARAQVAQAQGNWLQAGLYPNPTVGYEGAANNAPFDAHGAFVSQNIVLGDKLGLNRAVASCDVQRAQWEAQAQRLRVVNDIEIRYVAALGAQRQVAVTSELLKFASEGVRISEKLLEGEQVARADVLQARLQQSQTRILLRNAEVQAHAAWKQLGTIIGWNDFPLTPLEGNLEDPVPDVEWESAYGELVGGSPLIHAARSRSAAAMAQVRREQAEPIPNLQVTGSVGRDFLTPQFMMYGLQVGVALPVFDRNQGNIAAATAELATAQAEVSRLELSLRDQLAAAFQRYESARNEVETYRDSILPTARDNLDLTQHGYEEGEFDLLRVLTARRDLTEANINYVKALTELRIAVVEIRGMLLTGGLDATQSNPIGSNGAGQTSGAGN